MTTNEMERARLAGAYPATCEHPEAFTAIEYVVYRPSPEEVHSKAATQDWDFARFYLQPHLQGKLFSPEWYDALERREKTTSIRCCGECYTQLPSEIAKRENLARPTRPHAATEEEQTELQEIRERVEAGEAVYLCNECNEFKEQDELVQVRECPHCEETFDGSSEGRNCPSCNRPFSRLLTEDGCPDCLSENAPELVTLELLAAQKED